MAAEAWATLQRHPLGPEVPEDSVTPGIRDGHKPRRQAVNRQLRAQTRAAGTGGYAGSDPLARATSALLLLLSEHRPGDLVAVERPG
jgi:hypothetical protein